MGTADVVLIYLVSWHLFRHRAYALIAAALLALTPAHFIHSRLAMDYLYPVPFVLTWLLFLLKFDEHEPLWLIAVAGFALASASTAISRLSRSCRSTYCSAGSILAVGEAEGEQVAPGDV